MKQPANNRIAGFSLVEVLVGIAVLGLVVLPVCASLVLSVRINSHSRDLMNAQLEATAAVETLMANGVKPNTKCGLDTDKILQQDGDLQWTMEMENGVVIVVRQDAANDPDYAVTVTGEENGRTVAIETRIRAVEGGGA